MSQQALQMSLFECLSARKKSCQPTKRDGDGHYLWKACLISGKGKTGIMYLHIVVRSMQARDSPVQRRAHALKMEMLALVVCWQMANIGKQDYVEAMMMA